MAAKTGMVNETIFRAELQDFAQPAASQEKNHLGNQNQSES
jgi:hypothetical protein